jgi:hypothetical protein
MRTQNLIHCVSVIVGWYGNPGIDVAKPSAR